MKNTGQKSIWMMASCGIFSCYLRWGLASISLSINYIHTLMYISSINITFYLNSPLYMYIMQLGPLILWQIVRCNGEVLVPYKDQLLEVLQLTLHLKCVQGYELAAQLMRYILRALTLHYPLDYRSIADSFDRPVTEYLAINVRDIFIGQYAFFSDDWITFIAHICTIQCTWVLYQKIIYMAEYVNWM